MVGAINCCVEEDESNLLQQVIKSSRLIGCKFTAEEERTVIELQSEIGNKWATIATHLVGRTDNDVKNFWNSRQKRLARILHSQSPSRMKHKSSASTSWVRAHFLQVPEKSSIEGETSSKGQALNSSSHSSASTETNSRKMIPYTDSITGSYRSFEANNTAILDPLPLNTCWNNMEDDFRFSFPQEAPESIDKLDPGYLSPFGYCTNGNSLVDDVACFLPRFDERGKTIKQENDNLTKPDSFFNDFPLDMFDQIEPLPSPSNW